MGSINIDGAGNIALGYSVSGDATFPSIRYTSRAATDPLGQMAGGEVTCVAGTGSQTSSTNRWGDYSTLSVDPADDCTFWLTSEYYPTTSASDFRTRICSFRLPNCSESVTPPTVTITSPADGATATEGIPFTFVASANDAQDGDLTDSIAWSSGLSGDIGSGGSFSSTLPPGAHTITASVTDSGGLLGFDAVDVTVILESPLVEVNFVSIAEEDGRVLESSEDSDTGGSVSSTAAGTRALRIGDDSKDRQYKAFVSFDTSSIPDGATIVSAILQLRRGGARGQNPYATHGAARVDIAAGAFGGDPALESSDFGAPAIAVAVATLTDAPSNGDISEGELDATGLAAINKTGRTQFRIYFELDDNDDGSNDYMGYRSSETSNEDNRPRLIINYTLGGPPANTAPSVVLTSPSDLDTFSEGTEINFAGMATDDLDGDLTASLEWSSDLDGVIGSGGSFSQVLAVGAHTITATAMDSGGLVGTESLEITVTPASNDPPVVSITSPPSGTSVVEGTSVDFAGTANDTEDGDLTAALTWTSSLVGGIGAGGSFSSTLSLGTHTITASVTDSGGLGGSDTIDVTVTSAAGTPVEASFQSIAEEDGRVLESSEDSDTGGSVSSTAAGTRALRIGDDSKDRQYKAFVSVDTSSIPDGATIVSAILQLRRGGARGQNPYATHGASPRVRLVATRRSNRPISERRLSPWRLQP